jgi:hypothetical protein
MDEKSFKANFITTFLATWVANNYDECCMRGQHERLSDPPVEDAEFLANEAWNRYNEER